MKQLLRQAHELAKRAKKDAKCGVNGCTTDKDLELVWLQPFDPIDHEPVPITLCQRHQDWAEERNAFAEQMADELRECRKEIGQAHIADVQRLAHPQDGQLSEEFLMGDPETGPDYLDGDSE